MARAILSLVYVALLLMVIAGVLAHAWALVIYLLLLGLLLFVGAGLWRSWTGQ